MKLKIKDFLKEEIDIDVVDDYDERLYIAFCGPLYLTTEGEAYFKDVLDIPVEIRTNTMFGDLAVVKVNESLPNFKRLLNKTKELFESAAGYCADEDWDKWFSSEPLTEDRSLAKPIKKDMKNAYKAFDAKRDWVRKENDKVTKRWNEISNGKPMDDDVKDFLLKKEPKFGTYKPRFNKALEIVDYPFYVTYYEEHPFYHPEEGGYYVAGSAATMSKGFDNKEDAIQYAKEWADEEGFERVSDTYYHVGSKYIGDDDSIRVETAKEYLSHEEGDEIYQ